MPIIKSKYKFRKVYRPHGTKYAQATGANLARTIAKATKSFVKEFGYLPEEANTIVDVTGATRIYIVDFMEIKEPNVDKKR